MCENLVNWVVARAAEIIAHDDRLSSLRQEFKERYGILRK
jgi:hypothetical protein